MCAAAGSRTSQAPTDNAMTNAELINFVKSFSFERCQRGGQGFRRILLQLFGFVGHGKSSFINTCLMVWSNGHYQNRAGSASTDESHTTQRFTYPLTGNIILVDNRGCSEMNAYKTGEIYAQLANLLPVDTPVGWSRGFGLADRIVEAEPLVSASDFILPIFVYSVRKSMAPSELEALKQMLLTCRRLTGIFPMVLLTHKNHGHLDEVEDMFRNIGTERFFFLENYTQSNQKPLRETHQSVLKFLYEVVQDVQFQVEQLRDPEKEMQKRKISILKYIHDREMEAHTRNVNRQSEVEGLRMEQDIRLWRERQEIQRRRLEQQHRERMRRLEEEYERLRLQDEQRPKEPQPKKKGLTKKKKKIGKNKSKDNSAAYSKTQK